jgi:DNA primase catalytic subunit
MPVTISDYYVLNPVYEPPRIEYREFAFVKGGRFFRHRAFWNIRDLRTFLVLFAPEEVFYSGAYYQHPGILPMDEKKKYRVGADLIFDIDCDMLLAQTVEEAYFYALKLVDIMRQAYGFKEVIQAFSGRRGYHVHVQDFEATRFDIEERREIVDCLTGNPDSSYFDPIDPVVTKDIARLIRLPGSLYVRGGHAGVCRLLDIPGIELVDNNNSSTFSSTAYCQHLIHPACGFWQIYFFKKLNIVYKQNISLVI